jgi:hypothetical protein
MRESRICRACDHKKAAADYNSPYSVDCRLCVETRRARKRSAEQAAKRKPLARICQRADCDEPIVAGVEGARCCTRHHYVFGTPPETERPRATDYLLYATYDRLTEG